MRLSRPPFARSLAIAAFAAAVGTTTLPALAAGDHDHDHGQATTPTVAEEVLQQASEQTRALLAFANQWQQAGGAGKAAALEKLKAKAEERKAKLLELMETHPVQVLEATLSDEQRAGMPAEVQAMLEQKLELEGEYEAIYEEDFEAGTARLRQFVSTPFGERFELHVAGKGSSALTGQQVQLNGLLFPQDGKSEDTNGELLLDDSGILIMGADGGDNGGTAGALPNTFGERKVAVIMINFQDNPDDKPWTATEAGNLIFGQVSDFLQENSYNQTWLGGDVFGWLTLPLDGNTTCPDYTAAADAAAEAAGAALSSYPHIVYLLPPASACNGTFGTVGGSPSRAWINGGLRWYSIAHELGHNLGLTHSKGLTCDGGAVMDSSCTEAEYGDRQDMMGTEYGHFNAFQKEKLGWLGYDRSPPVTTVTADGTYVIAPTETDDNQVKALKILRDTDTTTGQRSWYYLEFRQPVGFDTYLFNPYDPYKAPDNLNNGVVIHSWTEGRGSPLVLDMTPDSITSSSQKDLIDPALEIGQSYTDPEAGITITPLAADSSGITVDISFGGGSGSSGGGDTTNSAPVAYDDNANTAFETTVTINVLANDSDADGDVLSVTSLSGVNGSAKINSDGTVTYTPPAGFSGTETFSYTISDGNGGSSNANVSVSVSSGNSAPIASDDSASTAFETPVTINVLGNDSDPDGDSLSVTSLSGVNGSATINGDGTVTYTPPAGFSGTETFSYTVSDGNGGSASATVTVTVEADTTISSAGIELSGSLTKNKGTKIVTLNWSNASSTDVRIYRDGALLLTTVNDGKHQDSFTGKATRDYQLCEVGTDRCSPVVTVSE